MGASPKQFGLAPILLIAVHINTNGDTRQDTARDTGTRGNLGWRRGAGPAKRASARTGFTRRQV